MKVSCSLNSWKIFGPCTPKQSSDQRLVFNMISVPDNPFLDPERFEMFDKRKRATHNQNVISPHCDDCPVHRAKKLHHDFLDVVVGEGL